MEGCIACEQGKGYVSRARAVSGPVVLVWKADGCDHRPPAHLRNSSKLKLGRKLYFFVCLAYGLVICGGCNVIKLAIRPKQANYYVVKICLPLQSERSKLRSKERVGAMGHILLAR